MSTVRIPGTALVLVLLAACGGGGGHDEPVVVAPPPVSNEVPPSAYASTAGFASYLGNLAPSETSEPLDVDKVVPPTSESEEPVAI